MYMIHMKVPTNVCKVLCVVMCVCVFSCHVHADTHVYAACPHLDRRRRAWRVEAWLWEKCVG